MTRLLEICVDSPAGLSDAIEGGADRIELCSALALGGLTPSAGLVALAAKAPVPVLAMIRPRAGGFDWSDPEITAMEVEIAAMRAAGLAGVVIGATKGSRLDAVALARLVQAADGMDITLHRCVDLLDDPVEAVSMARDLGIARILSSGGALTALEGIETLTRMMQAAGSDVTILPGSGISVATLPDLLDRLNPSEVHASASVADPATGKVAALGFQPQGAKRTDSATVAVLKRLLQAG